MTENQDSLAPTQSISLESLTQWPLACATLPLCLGLLPPTKPELRTEVSFEGIEECVFAGKLSL